jgi:hypothetical protein
MTRHILFQIPRQTQQLTILVYVFCFYLFFFGKDKLTSRCIVVVVNLVPFATFFLHLFALYRKQSIIGCQGKVILSFNNFKI